MSHHGKKYTAVRAKVDRTKTYEVAEAIAFLKANKYSKFDETAEIAFRLGVDPTQSDQNVRGTVALPHGTGKRCGCWCSPADPRPMPPVLRVRTMWGSRI